MKKTSPVCPSTMVGVDPHERIPTSFDNFLLELEHVSASCSGNDPWPLFRGHADSKWLLESTFARSCKKILFNLQAHIKVNDHVRQSIVYHRILLNLLLLKFGDIVRPHKELEILENKHGADAWFELMKRYQQYPEEDLFYLKGTFFLDWSASKDAALFFANLNRKGDGALWICDTVATGKTLQIKKVREILDLRGE